MEAPQEPLSKDLMTGHFTARLDPDGTLTIVEEYTAYNAMEEPFNAFTELVMPAQAACALHKLLNSPAGRKRIGARLQKEGKRQTRIKRADWVTCKGSDVIGLVKRLAKDGSWADVEWPTCTKRMQTSVLQPQATIQRNDGWTITDIMREQELKDEH